LLFEYEGSAVQIGVIVTWNLHNTREVFYNSNCVLMDFNRYFDLRENLRTMKFLNHISNVRSSIILVSIDALASHLILLPNGLPIAADEDWELVPENIQRLRKFIVGRDILLTGTRNRELFLAGRDNVFRWGHKKWSRVSGPSIANIITKHASADIAKNLVDVVVAMSHAKMGALFVIAGEPGSVLSGATGGIARLFKSNQLFNIKDVDKWSTARFAAIDGATVLTPSGQVFEAGVILAIPESLLLSGEGARTVAAMSASMHGIAVKVSTDGPISIYEKGKLVRSA
jgi:hypothetical protein